MGILTGCVEILLGLLEWWDAARINRLFGWKSTAHRTRVFGFIGCGCFSILMCCLSHFWDTRMDAFTFLAGLGGLLVFVSLRDMHRLRACRLTVQGVFLRFSPVVGMMPAFAYQVGKQHYRETCQPCDIRAARAQLEEGRSYPIFVHEKNPQLFVLTRKQDPFTWFSLLLGLLLLIPWLLYCGRLLFCC